MKAKPEQLCSSATATPEHSISLRVIQQYSQTIAVCDFNQVDFLINLTNTTLGHYIENTSATKNLTWIEIYKADRVADVSLTQWLALTPSDLASSILKVPAEFVETLKKQKQVLIKGN